MQSSPSQTFPDLATRLGWVSYFNDAASHVLTRVLPLYLTCVLGVSPTFIGVMEGLAEGLAVLVKSVSGWLSDRASSRKGFVFGGYALSFAARCLYLVNQFPLLLGLSRILDRIGKGLRCPARDAMVADAAAFGKAGNAFGVTSLLDALGAFTGLGLALLMGLGQGAMTRSIFQRLVWMALPLGLAALILMIRFVPRVPRLSRAARLNWGVPQEIRGFLGLVFLFGLANSSDAFLVLKAQGLGLSIRDTLLLFLGFNLVAAMLALPLGRLSDRVSNRWGRVPFLVIGWIIYALCYGAFSYSNSSFGFGIILLVYGSYYGFTEGSLRAILAELLPTEKRGSGYGALQLVLGGSTLLASPIMGMLMVKFGTHIAFLASSFTALIAAMGLLYWCRSNRH